MSKSSRVMPTNPRNHHFNLPFFFLFFFSFYFLFNCDKSLFLLEMYILMIQEILFGSPSFVHNIHNITNPKTQIKGLLGISLQLLISWSNHVILLSCLLPCFLLFAIVGRTQPSTTSRPILKRCSVSFVDIGLRQFGNVVGRRNPRTCCFVVSRINFQRDGGFVTIGCNTKCSYWSFRNSYLAINWAIISNQIYFCCRPARHEKKRNVSIFVGLFLPCRLCFLDSLLVFCLLFYSVGTIIYQAWRQ